MKKHLLTILTSFLLIFLTITSFAQSNNGVNKYKITGKQLPCVGTLEVYTITPKPAEVIEFEFDGPRAAANEVEWQLISVSADKSQATFRVGDKPGTIRAKPNSGATNTENLVVHPVHSLNLSIQGPGTVCTNQQQEFKLVIGNLNKGKKNNKEITPGDLTITWEVPAGLTIVGAANTSVLTVMPTGDFTSGTVKVTVEVPGGVNDPTNNGNGVGRVTGFCLASESATLAVGKGANCGTTPPVCAAPQVSITGPASVCISQAQAVTFTANVTNPTAAMDYKWNVPNGWFISAGQGTNSIKVLVGNTAGPVGVTVTNNCQMAGSDVNEVIFDTDCGTTPPVCLNPLVNITGPATVCPSQTEVVTFSAGVGNATADMTYDWSIPEGWFIQEGQGTNTIEVLVGNTPGQIGLTVTNNCGKVTSDIHAVTFLNNCGNNPPNCTAPQVTITGPAEVCAFSDEPVAFTADVTNGEGNLEFVWTVPADWYILDGETTNTIMVQVGSESGSVTLSVKKLNCGLSGADNLAVTTLDDCTPIIVLPVELISFAGQSNKEGVLLQWSTATEKNNDRFELERSQDGKTFFQIGQVKGKGTTNSRQVYSMRDSRAGKGNNYYRLKQVDQNGEFEYSNIIVVNHSYGLAVTNLLVAPNPVTNGRFTLQLPEVATNAQVQIIDLNGRVVAKQNLEAGSYEASFSTQTLNMPAGLYIIELKDGSNISRAKLMVR